MLKIAAASALCLAAASVGVQAPGVVSASSRRAPASFPAYPRYCSYHVLVSIQTSQGCLVRTADGLPTSASIVASPRVVGIGQRMTFTLSAPYPLCKKDPKAEATKTGCILSIDWNVPIAAGLRYIPVAGGGGYGSYPPELRPVSSTACPESVVTIYSCTATMVPGHDPRFIWSTRWEVILVEVSLVAGSSIGGGLELETAIHVTGQKPKCGVPASNICPLKVFVRALQQIRSGLAIDDNYPDGGPVNFTVPSFSKPGSNYTPAGEAGQRCESGCANLLVSMVNPNTNKPVPGASVTVSLDPIAHSDEGGSEFVCTNSDPSQVRCGMSLSNLTADARGQLHLLYWAPGETDTERTALNARATCGSAPHCHGEAESSTTLTVKPYLIYHGGGDLDAHEVSVLVGLARDRALSAILNKAGGEKLVETAFDGYFKWIEGEELHEALVADFGPFPLGVFFAGVELVHLALEIQEQDGLISMFLEKIGVAGGGLYADPFEAKPSIGPSGPYLDAILHSLFTPGHIHTGGVLWSDAKHLAFQYSGTQSDFTFRPEAIQVDIYDVSHCEQSEEGDCGPGYTHSRGIRPALCFVFSGDDGRPPDWSANFCVPQYDAVEWDKTQPGLNHSLPA